MDDHQVGTMALNRHAPRRVAELGVIETMRVEVESTCDAVGGALRVLEGATENYCLVRIPSPWLRGFPFDALE